MISREPSLIIVREALVAAKAQPSGYPQAEALARALDSLSDDLLFLINTNPSPEDLNSLRGRNIRRLSELSEHGESILLLGRPHIPKLLEGYTEPPYMTGIVSFRESHLVSGHRKRRAGYDLEVPIDLIRSVSTAPAHTL